MANLRTAFCNYYATLKLYVYLLTYLLTIIDYASGSSLSMSYWANL